MAGYQGDIVLGDTIDIKFCTVQSTGAPTTLAGSPVISAYVGNSTTEITAGITLTVDFDSRTGLNNVRVVASGGNGFAAATNVSLIITTGTVNSVSVVGYEVGSFSIQNRGISSINGIAATGVTTINPVIGVASTTSYGVRKNSAKAGFMFAITDSTTHLPKTGATVAVQRSLDGAAFANATNTPATEVSGGWYKIDLAAGDLNGDTVALKMTGSGCDQLNITLVTTS